MRMTNNTILITGGGSGIGRGLAEAFHKLDNQVVIAGRDQKKLDEVTTANPGMRSLTVDMANTDSVLSFAAKITFEFPSLDVVILNAGIKRPENILNRKEPLSDVDATIATGPIHLVADLLPTLRKQSHTAMMTVSSGLASYLLRYGLLLCDQSGNPLIHSVAALSTERYVDTGDRVDSAVCADEPRRPAASERSASSAAGRLHRRSDGYSLKISLTSRKSP
jgi:NAD(P)-dependent dehydrogenase (short-subunit alcohol dehydrogenase family)